MSAITFGLSATFPTQLPGQPWDVNWTKPILQVSWNVSFYRSGSYLAPIGAAQGKIQSNSINVTSISPDVFTYGNYALLYGNHSPAAVAMWSDASNGITEQAISLKDWDSVKDIEVTDLSCQHLLVDGFVDAWINAPSDNASHEIDLYAVKRGAVALGNGNDTVQVNVLANEYSWPSHFNITAGDGDDTVEVLPQPTHWALPDNWVGWANHTPERTTADVTVGNGNDTVALTEVSGTIHIGNGTDTINIADGNSTVWLGAGTDTVRIGTLTFAGSVAPVARDTTVGSSIVHVGSGHADITIDDTISNLTPHVTLVFTRGETGGDTLATADVLRYGHNGVGGGFVAGDLRTLTVDLAGYSPGSKVTLNPAPDGRPMLLQIHDAATGGIDALALSGASLTSAAALQLHFV